MYYKITKYFHVFMNFLESKVHMSLYQIENLLQKN